MGAHFKLLVAAHYVPGHYYLAFVDFESERFLYADPYHVDKPVKRGIGLKALKKLQEHVQEEL